jgi:hypothetical protein
MLRSGILPGAGWRAWAVRLALVCFVAFHGLGLFHHHASQVEYDGCAVCHVVEHQPLDVPNVGLAAPLALFVLLFVVAFRVAAAPVLLDVLTRPRSRAPPSFSVS